MTSHKFSASEYEADFETTRTSLPIYQYQESIVEAVDEFQVLIVCGDTGSGKTTQLPQYLHEQRKDARIIVTQPRRIAAISAAQRVAHETSTPLGGLVGYSVRFESAKSADTKILYVTDGTLLRSVASSSESLDDLADIVILDEAHERSLETDVLFGLLKRACAVRPSLKLIVMSATLNMDKFSGFFNEAPVFTVPGRMYPVDLFYAAKMKWSALKGQIVAKTVEAVMQIHKSEEPGDILVFLTGQGDIESCARLITQEARLLHPKSDIQFFPDVQDLSIHPIYSALETHDQKSVFRPARKGFRKCVLATNIAQTSVTIPGIRFVVDCGFVKEKMADAATGVDALLVVPISKAAATQRAGRAGRTAPGKVFRLYSRDAFDDLGEDTIPEIQRSSLLGTVLSLKRMGIHDVLGFEFIDKPERDHVVKALHQLYYLGALDADGKLTTLGEQMAQIPASPFLSRALLASEQFKCTSELLTLTALLSGEEVFAHPRQDTQRITAEVAHAAFGHASGDHVALLCVYDAWIASGERESWCRDQFLRSRSLVAAKNVRVQFADILRGFRINVDSSCRIHESRRESRRQTDSRRESGSRRESDRRYERRESESDRKRVRRENHVSEDGFVFEHHDSHDSKQILAEYDAQAILKALCTGLFSNTAKRHPQRAYFYHYLTSAVKSGGEVSSSSANANALLSLHLSPTSCLAGPTTNAGGMGINDAILRSGLEWVLYQDVQFVTRANMRIVSRIDFGWVEEGISRVRGCDSARLLGLVEAKGSSTRAAGEDVGEKGVPATSNLAVSRDPEVDPAKEREDKAEAARLRYLSRKRK
ncbi:hypothetical protein CcCBS67573_g02580 [Chytriomyces confervae]|uniref:RNA helicase n=1 Tax=Chytriomyces confervae TaxID=246404 RepID=A0A507FL17_9FUNG|nr:hypothetical protein CcCBS67573_g02580 [Chytriomyces confervae]